MLEVTGLSAGYGDAPVLADVSFRVPRGETTCLLGPNGAGKTTLLRVLTGLLPGASGRIVLDGGEIGGLAPHERVARGMTMVPEGRRLWPGLTVREALEMGAFRERSRKAVEARMARVFDLFPVLEERKDQLCGTLSGGEQQMAAVGRGLMAAPRLMVLDEPSLGLAPRVAKGLFAAVQAIASAGTTVLLVEQNARAALAVSRTGYVMEGGRVVLSGEAVALRDAPQVREAYLGL